MAAPHVERSISTDEGAPWDGHLRIEITQESQDFGQMTSDVKVAGYMVNDNDWEVDHPGGQTVERHIGGEQTYSPSDFDFNINAHRELCYISHTFTVPHNNDGTKTVTFHVHYGITDTPTFQHDMQVDATLTLTPFQLGGWIRTSQTTDIHILGAQPRWIHGVPYVRYQGKWKRAVPYVRTGGVWKSCS
jgi:hypothetical protein